MTAAVWAQTLGTLADRAADKWPLLLLPALWVAALYVRRRNWVRYARHHWRAHPSIERHSHERGEP